MSKLSISRVLRMLLQTVYLGPSFSRKIVGKMTPFMQPRSILRRKERSGFGRMAKMGLRLS